MDFNSLAKSLVKSRAMGFGVEPSDVVNALAREGKVKVVGGNIALVEPPLVIAQPHPALDPLIARNAELEAELKATTDHALAIYRENERLRTALFFYADEGAWGVRDKTALMDVGKVARKAMKRDD